MHLFTEDWYHGIIQQTTGGFGDDTSDDAHAMARAHLIGLCCIAQAIDNAFGYVSGRDNAFTALESIAGSLEGIASAIEVAANTDTETSG